MRKSKYSPELIAKGRKMYEDGFSVTVIKAELGFKTREAVYYHCVPSYRQSATKAIRKWVANNREQVVTQQKKYYREVFYPKNREKILKYLRELRQSRKAK